ncbi:MAG TPA: hypothetical protein VJN18_31670 [Polyangiaceae bacterium]|nr:hypothetical protein [Polyangiaceae bacterium]
MTLPWRSGTGFAILLWLLAVLHAVTVVTALLRKPDWLTWSWRALAIASLVAFLILAWSMTAAALYVSRLYLRLGPPVAFAILLAGVLLALLTLPIGIWGALRTLPVRLRSPRKLGAGSVALLVSAMVTLPLASRAAQGERVVRATSEVSNQLQEVLEQQVEQAGRGGRRSVAGAGPAHCREPIVPERLTLLVSYVRASKAQSKCLQASTPRALRSRLKKLLERTQRGSTVVMDLIKVIKPLERGMPLLDALEVRPGLDGVCEDRRCLPAWQLVLSDAFAENRPLSAIPDASYGFSAEAVRRALGSRNADQDLGIDGLTRIETDSFAVDASGVHRLTRTRTTPPALSRLGVEQAVLSAQRHIVSAQERDGTFRYTLDPKTGQEDNATLNLPRQAGTTYALCELGQPDLVKGTVERALAAFEPTEKQMGTISALGVNEDYGLGKSALPLLSLLRCRELVGPVNDRLIGQLSRLMLKMQRENGSFYPIVDVGAKQGTGAHEALYAAGQAVLALVLLEQQLKALAGGAAEPLPSAQQVKQTLDRAMDHYGGPYWPTPLRDFFFFEEGWHCLAARTALTSHRHDAYEQLCIDYVASRARFILRPEDTSEPNFVGGYGVSDLFPPRNTATAGVGEALNAAVAIKLERGMPVDEDKARLRDLITFLLRAQWSEAGCYACRKPEQVQGAFSQMLASPSIRIDYVQHAMAAIGHGGRLLDLK